MDQIEKVNLMLGILDDKMTPADKVNIVAGVIIFGILTVIIAGQQ